MQRRVRSEQEYFGTSFNENDLSRYIINASIEVHRTLGGPGLLESIYEHALAWELEEQGFLVQRQLQLPVKYKSITIASPLKLDLLINHKVIIECKAIEAFNELYKAQALTYLRITGLKLAMVINFGEVLVKDGIHRVVNGLDGSSQETLN